MKKILCLLALCLWMTGCARLDVVAGIDSDNRAILQYDVELSLQGRDPREQLSIREGLLQLVNVYTQDYGFTLLPESQMGEQGRFAFTLRKEVENASYEQAAETLRDMLSDEKSSLFTLADVQLHQGQTQDVLVLDVQLDVNRILQSSTVDQLPYYTAEEFWQGVQDSRGQLVLMLPAADGPGKMGQARLEGDLDFTQPVDLRLESRIAHSALSPHQQDILLAVGVGVAVFGFALALASRLIGKKQA